MFRRYLFVALAVAGVATGCGKSGERQIPTSPSGSDGASNAANITAPTAVSPSDDQQLDTLRPTLTVNNATSSGSGSRSYEFQISDNTLFSATTTSVTLGSFFVTVTQTGVPEGAATTSFTPTSDLLPTTRYYWRARANQGSSSGPWSAPMRFRTQVTSFKSGNQVFDLLTNGRTVADQTRNISYAFEGDANPGAKLEGPDSFLRYAVGSLPEGEVSFIARRVKPGDDSFNGQVKVVSMQDGTGDFNSNSFRVRGEKRPPGEGSKFVFQFVSQNNVQNAVETGGLTWQDHRPYFFKLEWRSGTARMRVFSGETEASGTLVDLTSPYTGPYNASNLNVIMGSLTNDSLRDIRISRLYISPFPRPMSLGSALTK